MNVRTKICNYVIKHTYVITFLFGALAIISLAFFALSDSLHSARLSEQQVRQSAIDAELSNFLYLVKENSLLDNPDSSADQRNLSFNTLKSSFYTYLLNRSNARELTAEKINWDAPRACLLEFSKLPEIDKDANPFKIQTCFAAVANDPRGKYAYFSVRYPTPSISRHRSGNSLEQSDRVVLSIGKEKPVIATLIFEPPKLAASRYPSQINRFSGIHEISAFISPNIDKATRAINAQAFERSSEEQPHQNFVTIVGRIDTGILEGLNSNTEEWPDRSLKRMGIGMKIYAGASQGQVKEMITIDTDTKGQALVSLEKIYLSTITRDGKLDLFYESISGNKKVWSSSDLKLPSATRQSSWTQIVFDKWARMTNLAGPTSQNLISAEKSQLIGGPFGTFSASLVAEPIVLPEIVTRVFGWMTAVILLMALLFIAGIYAGVRLFLLGKRAWRMTGNIREFTPLESPYKGKKDEISRLGHILYLWFNRISYKHKKIKKSIEADAASKERDVLLMQTKLELRQDTLEAIGHEFRSPLQTLLNKVAMDSDLYNPLLRMQNGIEKLYLAASVEEGIDNQEIISSRVDLADFLFSYTQNRTSAAGNIIYIGPRENVMTDMDPIMVERVIDHVIDNATRYCPSDGQIRLSLIDIDKYPTVEIFNNGPLISEELLPRLFKVGTSDKSSIKNHGLGLYASRIYLLKMKATISVQNSQNGVVVKIVFESVENK
ncbi:hypothetical protein GCM10027276_09340 [Comamonas piscis]